MDLDEYAGQLKCSRGTGDNMTEFTTRIATVGKRGQGLNHISNTAEAK